MKLWTFFAGTTAALAGAFYVAARSKTHLREQVIDTALDDSFPCSDPPCWTSDTGVRRA